MSSDPIIDATTVAEFFVAADAVYHLDVPTSFPDGTELARMWGVRITVAKDPEPGVVYRATGTYPIAGVTTILYVDLAARARATRRRQLSVHVHHWKEKPWPDPAPRPRRGAPSFHAVPRGKP